MSSWVDNMSMSDLVIEVQKLAKRINYREPDLRTAILTEAARRLTEYRQRERRGG